MSLLSDRAAVQTARADAARACGAIAPATAALRVRLAAHPVLATAVALAAGFIAARLIAAPLRGFGRGGVHVLRHGLRVLRLLV